MCINVLTCINEYMCIQLSTCIHITLYNVKCYIYRWKVWGGDQLLRKSPIFGGELVHDKEREKVVYKEVDGAVYRGCCIGIQ